MRELLGFEVNKVFTLFLRNNNQNNLIYSPLCVFFWIGERCNHAAEMLLGMQGVFAALMDKTFICIVHMHVFFWEQLVHMHVSCDHLCIILFRQWAF